MVIYAILSNDSDKSKTLSTLGDQMHAIVLSDLSIDEQINTLNEIIQYDCSYKYMAQLKLADLLLAEGKKAEAIRTYNDLASDKDGLVYLRSLAEQRLMLIEGTEPPPQNIYLFSNTLLKAMNLLKEEKNSDAILLLNNLKENFETPHTIKSIAIELLTILSQ